MEAHYKFIWEHRNSVISPPHRFPQVTVAGKWVRVSPRHSPIALELAWKPAFRRSPSPSQSARLQGSLRPGRVSTPLRLCLPVRSFKQGLCGHRQVPESLQEFAP